MNGSSFTLLEEDLKELNYLNFRNENIESDQIKLHNDIKLIVTPPSPLSSNMTIQQNFKEAQTEKPEAVELLPRRSSTIFRTPSMARRASFIVQKQQFLDFIKAQKSKLSLGSNRSSINTNKDENILAVRFKMQNREIGK